MRPFVREVRRLSLEGHIRQHRRLPGVRWKGLQLSLYALSYLKILCHVNMAPLQK